MLTGQEDGPFIDTGSRIQCGNITVPIKTETSIERPKSDNLDEDIRNATVYEKTGTRLAEDAKGVEEDEQFPVADSSDSDAASVGFASLESHCIQSFCWKSILIIGRKKGVLLRQ